MRNVTEHGYATYPRRFASYKWYKPLLVAALFAILYFTTAAILTGVAMVLSNGAISTGYDDFNTYTGPGALGTVGSLAVAIPMLAFAALIVKDRPFSSYSSSMGGWRWKLFFKILGIGLVIYGIPTAIFNWMEGGSGVVQFTTIGLILLTLLGPLQCVAEEYIFRGFIMQTVASWARFPILGLIVQLIIFASAHPYNTIGVLSICVSGLTFALLCLITKGLETSSALHIINNMITFYMTGFGIATIKSDVTISDLIFIIVFQGIFLAFVYFADRKWHWFDEVKKDDVSAFEAKYPRKAKG